MIKQLVVHKVFTNYPSCRTSARVVLRHRDQRFCMKYTYLPDIFHSKIRTEYIFQLKAYVWLVAETMPLCTLHLLALHNTTLNPLSTFLSNLKSSTVKPLVVSRVIRWIILPTKISTEHLLARNIQWDILLILPTVDNLPNDITEL